MKAIALYDKLREKGYVNEEIAEVVKTNLQNITDEVDTHILCILEIDRLEVFKKWSPHNYQYHLSTASTMFIAEQVDYCVEYLIKLITGEIQNA